MDWTGWLEVVLSIAALIAAILALVPYVAQWRLDYWVEWPFEVRASSAVVSVEGDTLIAELFVRNPTSASAHVSPTFTLENGGSAFPHHLVNTYTHQRTEETFSLFPHDAAKIAVHRGDGPLPSKIVRVSLTVESGDRSLSREFPICLGPLGDHPTQPCKSAKG